LFDEQDVADALPKAEAAKRKIARINSQIEVTAIVDDVNATNIERYATGANVLVDGLDNFETRYLANDSAVKHGVPYVYGGAVGTVGAAFTVLPHTEHGTAAWEGAAGLGAHPDVDRTARHPAGRPIDGVAAAGSRATPCLRCLFEEAPPPGTSATCDTVGVLGPAASIVANFEAAETLKILSGNFDKVSTTMLNFDLWSNSVMQLKVARAYEDGDCPCCKHRRFEYLDGRRGSGTTTLCGRDAVQLTHEQNAVKLDLDAVAARLRRHGPVTINRFMLRAELTDNGRRYELTLFTDGRAIVKGTHEAAVARSLYARYIGS
jgi:adenylyltransferase/sulfurtransferase